MIFHHKIFLIIFQQIFIVTCTVKLQEQFQWKALDYAYPTHNDRIQAILRGKFNPVNNLPVGIEIWKDKLFITVPRWRTGIPSTLNYISLKDTTTKSPLLIPYPSWSANELGNCERGLSTVYRLKADVCDRLWVLDTGTFGIEDTTQNLCPYALNVFDLKTNRRLRRYELRPEGTNPSTFIANIVVDIGNGCDDAHAYMSDELGYGLIVYSWRTDSSWRFQHSYFMPDPLAGDFNIGGLNFQWGTEGIFGMSLSPTLVDGTKILYFSPLASFRQFAVSTAVLQNSTRIANSYHDFIALATRGPNTHTTSHVMDCNGIEFFGLIDRNAIGCWNSFKPYGPQNIGIVDKDDIGLIFPADVKVDSNGNLWAISDRMSTFLLSNLDYNEINFRIYFAPIEHLIKGTVCESAPILDNYQQINDGQNLEFNPYPNTYY